jgi:hypothetical protein
LTVPPFCLYHLFNAMMSPTVRPDTILQGVPVARNRVLIALPPVAIITIGIITIAP